MEGEGFEPSVPRRETTLRDCLLIEEVRFAPDSALEGDGFEPSVPRQKDCEKAKESISHKRQVRKGRTGQSPQSMEVSIWNSLPKGAPF